MNHADFDQIARLLKDRSGLLLSRDKVYLVESRLVPVARKWKLVGLDDLLAMVRERADEALLRDIVEAMTTSDTSFFRDAKLYEQLRSWILPELVKGRVGTRTLRIWSAGCSSGQEPYSLAMLLADFAEKHPDWTIEIVATDIAAQMLAQGKEGTYSQFEVQRGLPIRLLIKYFKQVGDRWQISPAVRNLVSFRNFNLLSDPIVLGRFDLVLCRNVMGGFDQETRARVLDRIARQTPEDAYLVLGAGETTLGASNKFGIVNGHREIFAVAGQNPGLRHTAAG